MWLRYGIIFIATSLALLSTRGLTAGPGNPEMGRQVFRACAACHSLVPGRHMTGPSLASIWGQKAGAIEGFTRYSKALERADITWDERSLDGWRKNPKAFIPNNRMTFGGLKDNGQRRDLIAFLRSVSETEDGAPDQPTERRSEAMTGQGQMLNLKTLDANSRVTSIGHCADTYTVTTETEETHEFWAFNLRFKTDGSELGPVAGHPVIIGASMRGDRGFVIFASPAEISPFIEKGC